MGKESKKKRDKRNQENNLKASEKPCCNCGKPGAHYVPPSFGDKGFFACDQLTEDGSAKEVTETVLADMDLQAEIPRQPITAEEYAETRFKCKDGTLFHIRKGCFNGNGLTESISFGNIEDAFLAGVAEADFKYKKQIEETLADLRWGKMTINDKLKFGLPEDIAIKQRERRCNGIFLTAIRELEELIDEKV